MTPTIKTLAMLKKMREKGVSDLTGKLSQQNKVCQGYQNNIIALTALKDEPVRSASQAILPALMSNQSHYKNHLQKLINWQEQELVLAEKKRQSLQCDLVTEARKEKTVEIVMTEQMNDFRHYQDKQQQKITDALSTQAWKRAQG